MIGSRLLPPLIVPENIVSHYGGSLISLLADQVRHFEEVDLDVPDIFDYSPATFVGLPCLHQLLLRSEIITRFCSYVYPLFI